MKVSSIQQVLTIVLLFLFAGIAGAQTDNAGEYHKVASTLGLSWNSLGPDNLGGETRAVLIDKNDPTGQTIFTGGVCGGLWKSTNAGATWDTIAISIGNGSICCIAQDSSGNIFVGTGGGGFDVFEGGEGFATAILGGGIFKSTDDGATFNILPATTPSSSNSIGATWAYTNRIAVNPKNPLVIYAGVNQGLEMSIDGGNTWALVVSGGTCLDVKVSTDGTLAVACVGGNSYYLYPSSTDSYEDKTWTKIPYTGYDSLPQSGGGRIEFGISPTNANYVYASVINAGGSFNGIFFTMTAKTGGGKWYDIGPGGSKSFDPYSTGSADEGSYSNSIGVYSGSPSKALFGGVTLWAWQQLSPGDTVGGWTDITTAKYNSLSSLSYVHANIHNIQINGNNVYLGCDGGIYKSTDGGNTYQPYNRNYYSTEFFSLAFPSYVDPLNGEGLIGGTVDNGTIYISGKMFYPGDGVDRDSNDGGQCAISSLNPAIYYVTQSDGDDLLRSSGAPPADIYTTTRGLNVGANIDSIAWQESGCYVTPLALYENPYDTTTPDSMYWVANKAYGINDTIYPVSHNGSVSFPYILNKSVTPGDTVKVQNRVVSKIATAFSPSNRVWIMMQAANINSSPVWMPIGGPESTPDAFKGSDGVHCMAWSPNGDALFVGTVAGQFYRFSNLNTVVDSIYSTGAIMSMANGSKIPVINPNSKVISTSLSAALGVSGRDILSIAIDPKNGNHMLVTIGNYGNNDYLYYSNNALSVSPTFTLAQGNLPRMPVYGAILDIINSPYPNGAILATEHGTYSTTDATVAVPTWTQDNRNMTNTIAIAIKQQILPPWNCNNSGKIYIATCGRGLYVDSTFFLPTGISQINAPATLEGKLIVYPNPMNSFGNIVYSLPKIGNAKITIYDLEGRLVEEIPLTDTSPGLRKIRFSSQSMTVGTYIATLTGNGFRQSVKFVVEK